MGEPTHRLPERSATGRFRRLLAEPIVHFFAVGAVVFSAYWILADEPEEATFGNRIEIGADDVRQIAVGWQAQGRPPLTPAQMQSLIEQRVEDEILFREGLALGLDQDDEIIRRRIVQKMDFLAADIAAMQEPDRADLVEWYGKNPDRFALPPRASFRQLYFSPDKRGAAARDDAEAALDAIAGEGVDSARADAISDPFLLRPYYRDSSPEQLLKEFGPRFADELFQLPSGGWQGPIRSGYGWHLVWLESLDPGRVPAFEEIETDIRSAWIDEQYQEIKRLALEEMRSRYTVDVVPLGKVDLIEPKGSDQANVSSEAITQ